MTAIKTSTQSVPSSSLAYAVLIAILLAFGLYTAFVTGPAVRAAAHDNVVQAVADEDRQVCEKFGMRAGTDAFTTCSGELAVVRKNQVERDSAEAQGIL